MITFLLIHLVCAQNETSIETSIETYIPDISMTIVALIICCFLCLCIIIRICEYEYYIRKKNNSRINQV